LVIATQSDTGSIGIFWPASRGICSSYRIKEAIMQDWEREQKHNDIWSDYVRKKNLINNGFFKILHEEWDDIPDAAFRRAELKQNFIGAQAGTIIELFNNELITLEINRKFGREHYDDRLIKSL